MNKSPTFAPITLTIDLQRKCIRTGSNDISLPPAQLALLALLARRTQEGAPPLPAPHKEFGNPELAEAYLLELDRINPDKAHREKDNKTYRALKNGMDGDHFFQALSKLKASLSKLTQGANGACLIDGGKRPKRYRVTVAPENIHFV